MPLLYFIDCIIQNQTLLLAIKLFLPNKDVRLKKGIQVGEAIFAFALGIVSVFLLKIKPIIITKAVRIIT